MLISALNVRHSWKNQAKKFTPREAHEAGCVAINPAFLFRKEKTKEKVTGTFSTKEKERKGDRYFF